MLISTLRWALIKLWGRVLLYNITWLAKLFTLLHSSHLHTLANSVIKNQVHKNLLNNVFQSKCHHRHCSLSQQETSFVVRWHTNGMLLLNTNVRAPKKCCRFLLQHWSSLIYKSFLKSTKNKPFFFYSEMCDDYSEENRHSDNYL